MASRILSSVRLSRLSKPVTSLNNMRHFRSATPFRETAAAAAPLAAPRKPLGAFRGGIFGFLLGAVVSGSTTFYYVLEEYRVSNELLTEDIYALQAAVQRVHTYVSTLEDKVEEVERRRKP